MTLVMLAGYIRCSPFFSKSIAPVSASIKAAETAVRSAEGQLSSA